MSRFPLRYEGETSAVRMFAPCPVLFLLSLICLLFQPHSCSLQMEDWRARRTPPAPFSIACSMPRLAGLQKTYDEGAFHNPLSYAALEGAGKE